MVLLASALNPQTVWEFSAILVLLSGHWPPRGLLSGCWPPGLSSADGVDDSTDEGNEDSTAKAAGSSSEGNRAQPRACMPMRKLGCGLLPLLPCLAFPANWHPLSGLAFMRGEQLANLLCH